MVFGKTINNFFYDITSTNNIKLNKYYAENFSKTTGIEIQSQHGVVNRQLSMESIAVEYFLNSINPGTNEKNMNFIHI